VGDIREESREAEQGSMTEHPAYYPKAILKGMIEELAADRAELLGALEKIRYEIDTNQKSRALRSIDEIMAKMVKGNT
jgi:hypothetical protein